MAVHESGDTQLEAMRWGLIPPWVKDKSIGAKLANARAETIDEKPSFREPFQRRRCLLPVDGYFEWESRPSGKQPVYYSMCDGDLFCLAGLWETWAAPMQVTEPELPGLELGQAESETLRTFKHPGTESRGTTNIMMKSVPLLLKSSYVAIMRCNESVSRGAL